MRRDDPGRTAGRAGGTAVPDGPAAGRADPPPHAALHPGVLTTGAADQLAPWPDRHRAVFRAVLDRVGDSAVGVSAEEREKMFTGLYRTSRSAALLADFVTRAAERGLEPSVLSARRDKALPGSGLGLTLSRAVVHRHHGTIELIDADGPGTTVKVRLPIDAR